MTKRPPSRGKMSVSARVPAPDPSAVIVTWNEEAAFRFSSAERNIENAFSAVDPGTEVGESKSPSHAKRTDYQRSHRDLQSPFHPCHPGTPPTDALRVTSLPR